jgi:hypothetical protein
MSSVSNFGRIETDRAFGEAVWLELMESTPMQALPKSVITASNHAVTTRLDGRIDPSLWCVRRLSRRGTRSCECVR